MKRHHLVWLFTLFCVISAAVRAAAQAPPISTAPPPNSADTVEISSAENSYQNEISTWDGQVELHYQDQSVYCDHMVYDRSTKTMTTTGNVRIFSGTKIYRGENMTYNLDSKAIVSSDFYSEEYPKFIYGKTITTPGANHYHLTSANFTTSNRENPSYHLHAGTVEYRPGDVVVLKNVLLYIGDVPVFYFPVFVQSLTDKRPVYLFSLGNSGQYGYFINNKINFDAGPKLRGTVEIDLRQTRGLAGGVDAQYRPSVGNDILLKTYYAQDNLYDHASPGTPNAPSHGDLSKGNVFDGVPSGNRYRLAYQSHLQFGPDISTIADLNKWSDPWITRDFFRSEYQSENQPSNFVSLNGYNPNFTISLLVSPQVNPFFETVQRLPEFMVESKQQKIFGSPIEYLSQSSVVNFERHFADEQYFSNPQSYIYRSFPQPTAYDYYHPGAQNYTYNAGQQSNYSAYRYDTYHEFSYPHQYFNFLSLTPRVGGRLTYYSDTNQDLYDSVNGNGQDNNKIKNPALRLAGNVGLEGDFKLSRTWLNVKDPVLAIDGLRHELEPFFDAQFEPTPTKTPNEIRGFDSRLYSTELQPINQSGYNSIDSIDRQEVVRLGTKNFLQTKRDGANAELIDWETYMDADFAHNFSSATSSSTFSNIFNDIRYYFTPQFEFHSFSSLDINGSSYNEIDNDITYLPDPSLQLTVGDHYLNHSSIFPDSNNATFGFFYRLNEHWQIETQHQFEATNGHLQLQSYTIYRDLDAWQLGATYSTTQINPGVQDQSIYFTLTLKAFPEYAIHSPRL